MKFTLGDSVSVKQLPILISLVAVMLSSLTFYRTQIRKEQSLWVLLSQMWVDNDTMFVQAVIANNGNKPAIVPSIGVQGHIPGHGTFVFETRKDPLVLNPETTTAVLIEIPKELSSRITVRHQTELANLFLDFFAVYADKQHYSVSVDCPLTFRASHIEKFDCPRYIIDMAPVPAEEFLRSPQQVPK